jgi:hypothetical protein
MIHDYKRNGTTSLFAAMNMLDGTIIAAACSATGIRSTSISSTPSSVTSPPARRSTILDN